MLFILIYTFIGGLILYFIEKAIMKRRDLSRFHRNVGIVNLCMVVFFLILYVASPDLFSKDVKINNELSYICFSLLACYYYIVAAPLSVASLLMVYKTNSKSKASLYLNLIATVLLIISFLLFL